MKILKKKSKVEDTAEQVRSSTKYVRKRKPVDVNDLIPTPCVPFNLECSGHWEGAFKKGSIVNIIGDSSAGKTLFCLSVLAECSIIDRFDDYDFFFDDVERANEFDVEFIFGQECYNRIHGIEPGDYHSKTIEQFNDRIARLLEKGKPFIYILDSFDALTSESAIEHDEENRKLREKGQEVKGSYGDGKPKVFSAFCQQRIDDIQNSGSLIIIISQTRDNLGYGAKFTPKVRSGGRALKFYAAFEIWLAMQKNEKKGERTYITNTQAKISKNKLTGRRGSAYFQILFDHGIDYIQSCVQFLMEEGFWDHKKANKSEGNKAGIDTKGFYPSGNISYPNLVTWIESNNLEEDLAELCKEAYEIAIAKIAPTHRKFRYQRN